MIDALEGWTFDGPKGETTVRADDHALIQPMYQAKLVQDGEPGPRSSSTPCPRRRPAEVAVRMAGRVATTARHLAGRITRSKHPTSPPCRCGPASG